MERMLTRFLSLFLILNTQPLYAYLENLWDVPSWEEKHELVLGEARNNLYQLPVHDLPKVQKQGYLHAFKWPVEISGLFIPYESFKYFLNADDVNPLKKWFFNQAKKQVGIKNMTDFYQWLGLYPFPDQFVSSMPNEIIYPEGKKPDYYMGASIVDTKLGAKGLTFSCAACHSQELFGVTVMGLTNKRPAANDFFMMGKKYVPLLPPKLYSLSTKASNEEYELLKRSKKNFKSVDAVLPLSRGLDTSLAQIALSLAKRNDDEYATKNEALEKKPKPQPLKHIPADSKPAVWWNLKYKNRWLSDGSIVSGNPILTNFLWNEIGRGTDLKELEVWMQENKHTIVELTAAVFATNAPRWEAFFPHKKIDVEKAKRGQHHFMANCASCHGEYEKAWEANDPSMKYEKLIQTTKVFYHELTPVKDVGTDPRRFEGMKYFAESLNKLKISKWMKTVVKPQNGYVPPPLDGIWSRYPYLHNGSIPNLCDLMTPPSKRVKVFYQGPSVNAQTDFDFDCVGYPVGNKIPSSWKELENSKVDTTRDGLKNIGHYKMFLDQDGQELMTELEKSELREFLKTL
jgi:cytochrome c553